MHLKLLAVAFAAAVFVAAPVPAAAACCDQHAHQQAACCEMPCCADRAADIDIISALMTDDPQLNPAPPVRQTAEVWFHRPVMVGSSILQGRYVIEHDNNRMARGEPCTHIYAYDNREKPVAAFHCVHLERDRAGQNIVVLYTTSDGHTQRLSEFQFAGETAAHGYPTVR